MAGMFFELFAIAALVVGCGWYITSRRAALRRQALALFAQARTVDAQGQVVFDATQATVLSHDLQPMGSADTGPYLVATFECRMPDGQAWTVRVQTPHRQAAAQVSATPKPG